MRKKILIAKLGLDGHDRGARIVARAFRDAGYDVVYTGIRQSPEMVVNTALQEDVSVIGISILSGAHLVLIKKLLELMEEKNLKIPVVVGGIIPPQDIPKLKEMGVAEVFGSGTPTSKIVAFVNKILGDKYDSRRIF